jgi:hypothetical protein
MEETEESERKRERRPRDALKFISKASQQNVAKEMSQSFLTLKTEISKRFRNSRIRTHRTMNYPLLYFLWSFVSLISPKLFFILKCRNSGPNSKAFNCSLNRLNYYGPSGFIRVTPKLSFKFQVQWIWSKILWRDSSCWRSRIHFPDQLAQRVMHLKVHQFVCLLDIDEEIRI